MRKFTGRNDGHNNFVVGFGNDGSAYVTRSFTTWPAAEQFARRQARRGLWATIGTDRERMVRVFQPRKARR